MSNKTIHELDSLSEIAQNDEMLIYDISAGADNPTKKCTVDKIREPIYKIFDNTIDNTKFAMSTTANEEVTANYTGLLYLMLKKNSSATTAIFEDDTRILQDDIYSASSIYPSLTILIRKGHRYKWSGESEIYGQNFIPFF